MHVLAQLCCQAAGRQTAVRGCLLCSFKRCNGHARQREDMGSVHIVLATYLHIYRTQHTGPLRLKHLPAAHGRRAGLQGPEPRHCTCRSHLTAKPLTRMCTINVAVAAGQHVIAFGGHVIVFDCFACFFHEIIIIKCFRSNPSMNTFAKPPLTINYECM